MKKYKVISLIIEALGFVDKFQFSVKLQIILFHFFKLIFMLQFLQENFINFLLVNDRRKLFVFLYYINNTLWILNP